MKLTASNFVWQTFSGLPASKNSGGHKVGIIKSKEVDADDDDDDDDDDEPDDNEEDERDDPFEKPVMADVMLPEFKKIKMT